jgi:ASF1 like histone chaperone
MDMVWEKNGDNLYEFNLQAESPDLTKLQHMSECFETHGITIQANYRNQEFFRCTYFMSHIYPDDPEKKDEWSPSIRRKFAIKTPTILRKDINWDSDPVVEILNNEKNLVELD